MAIRRKHVQELVGNVLSRYRITSGPVAVRQIAADMGIDIKLDKVDDNLSGFLYRDKKAGRTIIGVNSAHSTNRQNFTIAHELGHYLLHEGEVIHLDEERGAFTTINYRSAESAKTNNDNEKEANLFAAELLMPEQLLRKELANKSYDLLEEDGLKVLAKKFGVSSMALTFRLSALGLIKT